MTTITKINQRLDRLDQQLEQLHKHLQGHSYEALNYKPDPEKWSGYAKPASPVAGRRLICEVYQEEIELQSYAGTKQLEDEF